MATRTGCPWVKQLVYSGQERYLIYIILKYHTVSRGVGITIGLAVTKRGTALGTVLGQILL